MEKKYRLDTEENKDFLKANAQALLNFGRQFPSPKGGSYYLGDDGTPWKDRNRETWITSRMAHVYSIGSMLGDPKSKDLATAAIRGLRTELHDDKSGGWYAGLTKDGEILPTKQCYAHAFVILAAGSGVLSGVEGAEELMEEALRVYDEKFWNEEEGLSCDTWNTEFTVLDPYRGLNANMHTVEAFLAVADVFGWKAQNVGENRNHGEDNSQRESFDAKLETKYRTRAGRIIDRVIGWAADNDYRIPEHFTDAWEPVLDMNKDKPDDPFKPYGATPGHGIEWARLIAQWAQSSKELSEEKRKHYIDVACKLYDRAVGDAWNADGAPGIVYTTDWEGKPVVRDRMHWTLAEAINTSSVLYRITGNEKYAEDFAEFMEYLDTKVLDHTCGSWFHQLDENNQVKGTVWPGKSDLYHAFQAMLIPYSKVDVSIATAIKDRRIVSCRQA